ncbi:MAG: MMPL family transporter [Gaiellales bacterium]|nr:MAG: MMPL family transporter [Gaiellales bacterium]
MLAAAASFSFRHRWLVLFLWVALLAGVAFWSERAGSAFSFDFRLPDSDSQRAMDLLEARFPSRSGATGSLVFKADAGIDDPAVQEEVAAVIGRIARVPHVEAVVSPYGPEGAAQVSPGGRIAQAVIQFDLSDEEIATELDTIAAIREIAAGAGGEGVRFELGGDMFVGHPAIGAEGVGLTAAVFILLIAFGSLLAMGLPIITALFGIGIGLSTVSLLSHVFSLPDFTTQLAAMIGIGVGIDYALFIVTRYRQGLREGLGPELATVQAIDTAGRSVVFAGVIVVISLMGMVLMNISFIQGLGAGAAVVVAITMLASVTLLPAVLGIVGRHIDRIRIPGLGRERPDGDESGLSFRWSRFIERRPWPALLLGLAVIMALALPFFSIELGSSDAGSRPESDTTRRAYDLEVEGFGPGSNGPLMLVAGIQGPADLEALERVRQAVAADGGVASVTPPLPNQEMSAAIMQVIPVTSPQDRGTVELIERLRGGVLPAATAGSGVEVHVGGITASFSDISALLTGRLPVFIGAVLALSFILLTVVFRSIAIPVKAVILNMLSIAAAYGVVVAVFQWGWGLGLIGLGSPGPIESFLPMMLFAILFGLSMDYEVFLLSRIKEEYDRTGDNTRSIADGLRRTARVITAAAAIMVTVFGSFLLGDQRVIKEFGFGLAVAILIDATLVRLLLVPAAMEIMGRANWWFPRWLRWLPEVHIDGNDVQVAAGQPAAAEPQAPATGEPVLVRVRGDG